MGASPSSRAHGLRAKAGDHVDLRTRMHQVGGIPTLAMERQSGHTVTFVLADLTDVADVCTALRASHLAHRSATVGIVLPTHRVHLAPVDAQLLSTFQGALPTLRVRVSQADTRLPVGLAPVFLLATHLIGGPPRAGRGAAAVVLSVTAAVAEAAAQYARHLVHTWRRWGAVDGPHLFRALCAAATHQVQRTYLPLVDTIRACSAAPAAGGGVRPMIHGMDGVDGDTLLRMLAGAVDAMQRLQITVSLVRPSTEDVVVLVVDDSTNIRTPHNPSRILMETLVALQLVLSGGPVEGLRNNLRFCCPNGEQDLLRVRKALAACARSHATGNAMVTGAASKRLPERQLVDDDGSEAAEATEASEVVAAAAKTQET